MDLKIDELAELSGVTRRTIRYYVAIGLLPAPGPKGVYDAAHLEQLEAIKRLQSQRLSLKEIGERLAPFPDNRTTGDNALSQHAANGDAALAEPSDSDPETPYRASPAAAQDSYAARGPGSLRSATIERPAGVKGHGRPFWLAISVLSLALGIAALVLSTIAVRHDGGATPATTTAPEACAALDEYTTSLGRLAGYYFGPDAPKTLSDSEVQALLTRMDQALTLRSKACAQK